MERMEIYLDPVYRIEFIQKRKKKKNRIFLRIPELFECPRVIITLMMFIRDARILREDVSGRGFTRFDNLRNPN